MKSFLFFLFFSFWHIHLFSQVYKADVDTITAFQKNTEIIVNPESEQLMPLVKLGMLWGFIKYHHPSVSKGMYNMDAELYRVIPSILNAKSDEVDKILDIWIDHFGNVDTLPVFKETIDKEKIKLHPDYGYLFNNKYFTKSTIGKLNNILNHRVDDFNHYYIKYNGFVGNPDFKNEINYQQSQFPNAYIRLISVYRYWNMIQYFYPHRHLIGEDWNSILSAYIPIFLSAKNESEYFKACCGIIARINDTHATVWGDNDIYYKVFGRNTLPLSCYYIEHKLLVTDVPDTLGLRQKIKVGDVITEINNEKIDDAISRLSTLISASNTSFKIWRLTDFKSHLFWGHDTSVSLTVMRNNEIIKMRLPKCQLPKNYRRKQLSESDTCFKIIGDNIGYIYPGKMNDSDIHKIKSVIGKTKALIIDLRGYPKSFIVYSLPNILKKDESQFCTISMMNIGTPGMFVASRQMKTGIKNNTPYNGKIVVLVDQRTLSQSEYTAMALQSIPNTYVIGDTTAGADGNVSPITLPGGIQTCISGLGILYPDGMESQRVGIKINKHVKPSIKGVLANEDEILNAALDYIKD